VVSFVNLEGRFTVDAARSHLPMWTEWGVRDAGHLIHSLGCTYLTALGRELGFASISEVPAPREGPFAHVEEDVRSDSVWFDATTRRVALVAEFERYAGRHKDLSSKAESLLLAHHRWASEDAVLVLAYWSIGLVNLPDHRALRELVSGGFQATGGVPVPGQSSARVLFYQFVVQEGPDGLFRLSSVFRRGEA